MWHAKARLKVYIAGSKHVSIQESHVCDCLKVLASLPEIILFHLKRSEIGPLPDQSGVDGFPDYLDMAPYLEQPGQHQTKQQKQEWQQRQMSCMYFLKCMIQHIPEKDGTNAGHYVAYVRVSDGYLCFDDSRVTLLSSEEVHSKRAFMLYYRQAPKGTSPQRITQVGTCFINGYPWHDNQIAIQSPQGKL